MSGALIREDWEGRTIDGKLPLLEWLGGGEGRGVFLTVRQGIQRAAIKLIAAEGVEADAYVAQWETAKALTHENLMPILESGRCVVDGVELVYVVMEHAEDNLSRIVGEHALAETEAVSVFVPVLSALAYLHSQKVVHGHVKPSNILSVGGKWKLASDDLWVAGGVTKQLGRPDDYNAPESLDGKLSPPVDIWSTGVTLVEAMTQRLPAWNWSTERAPIVPPSMPFLFAEAVRESLRVDPAARCSIPEMRSLLDGRGAAEPVAPPVRTARFAAVSVPAATSPMKVKQPGAEPVSAKAEVRTVAKWPVAAKSAGTQVAEAPIPVRAEAKQAAVDPPRAVTEQVAKAPEPVQAEAQTERREIEPVTDPIVPVAAGVGQATPVAETVAEQPLPVHAEAEPLVLTEVPVDEPEVVAKAENAAEEKPTAAAKPKERLLIDALGYSDPEPERTQANVKPAPKPERDEYAPDALFHRSIAYDDDDVEERGGFRFGRFLLVVVALVVVAGVLVNHFHPEWIPWTALGEKVSALRSSSTQTPQQPAQQPPAQPAAQQAAQAPASAPAPAATQPAPPSATGAEEQAASPSGSAAGATGTQSAAGTESSGATSSGATGTADAATSNGKTNTASPAVAEAPSRGRQTREAQQAPERAANAEGGVAERVLPNVAPGARSSMRRPIEVEVRVSVDRDGVVRNAESTNYGPGNYFARTSVRAAHAWRFNPPLRGGRPEPSEWLLRFNFTRATTEAIATQEGR